MSLDSLSNLILYTKIELQKLEITWNVFNLKKKKFSKSSSSACGAEKKVFVHCTSFLQGPLTVFCSAVDRIAMTMMMLRTTTKENSQPLNTFYLKILSQNYNGLDNI